MAGWYEILIQTSKKKRHGRRISRTIYLQIGYPWIYAIPMLPLEGKYTRDRNENPFGLISLKRIVADSPTPTGGTP
jgi:hypothetical protein